MGYYIIDAMSVILVTIGILLLIGCLDMDDTSTQQLRDDILRKYGIFY